ncbi:MAG: hypothetical protein AAF715_16990 [Myxococcota bacterium]
MPLAWRAALGAPSAPDAARPLIQPHLAPTPPAPEPTRTAPKARPAALELLWFDETRADDVGASETFSAAVEDQRPPRDAPARPGRRLAPTTPGDRPAPSPRSVYGAALRRGPVSGDLAALALAVDEALRDEASPPPPLALVQGTLRLGFDARRELTAVSALARTIAQAHKPVADELAHADRLIEADVVADGGVLRRMTERIHAAWRQSNRSLPDDYIAASSRRSLLLERAYDRVPLRDAVWLRGEVTRHDHGKGRAMVAYLPEATAGLLPLCLSFPARLVVEVLPRQDDSEGATLALFVLGIARERSSAMDPRG